MAKHVRITSSGPVGAAFGWFSWTPTTVTAAAAAPEPARPPARRLPAPPSSPHPSPLHPLPVRPRGSPERIPAPTAPADRPDVDTMRRVLSALRRL